jgi:hypothetical protein
MGETVVLGAPRLINATDKQTTPFSSNPDLCRMLLHVLQWFATKNLAGHPFGSSLCNSFDSFSTLPPFRPVMATAVQW